jgi:hypothetical protein
MQRRCAEGSEWNEVAAQRRDAVAATDGEREEAEDTDFCLQGLLAVSAAVLGRVLCQRLNELRAYQAA